MWDLAIDCLDKIKNKMMDSSRTSSVEILKVPCTNYTYKSDLFRRGHVSVVDAREEHKLWILHFTIFPKWNDPSPIYGFDIVAGPSRISGAFHDFSNGGDENHFMMKWFANHTKDLVWKKKRELPEWADKIFSESMVAVGAINKEEEANAFINLGLESLDYYLKNVSATEGESNAVYAQNFYCKNQQLNPHTPRTMRMIGMSEQEAKDFMEKELFPITR